MTEKKDTPSVNNSIQTRLSGVMLMVLVFALGINFFIFSQIQNAVTRIDAVFSSNVDVNELSEALELVENTVYEYLNTKSTETLETITVMTRITKSDRRSQRQKHGQRSKDARKKHPQDVRELSGSDK